MDYKCLAFDWHGSLFSWPAFWKGLKVAACKVVSRAQKKNPRPAISCHSCGKNQKTKKKKKAIVNQIGIGIDWGLGFDLSTCFTWSQKKSLPSASWAPSVQVRKCVCVCEYMAIPALWRFRFSSRRRMKMCVVPNQLGAWWDKRRGKCERAQLTRFRQVQQAGKSAENGGGAKEKKGGVVVREGAPAEAAQKEGPAEDSPSQRAGVY